jgi:methyl-accepting chemotaxis protein
MERTQHVAAITEEQLAAMEETSAASVSLIYIAQELSLQAGKIKV